MTQILSIKSAAPEKTVNLTDFAVEKVRELIAAESETWPRSSCGCPAWWL